VSTIRQLTEAFPEISTSYGPFGEELNRHYRNAVCTFESVSDSFRSGRFRECPDALLVCAKHVQNIIDEANSFKYLTVDHKTQIIASIELYDEFVRLLRRTCYSIS